MFTQITAVDPPVQYPNKFQAGDIAIALKNVKFADGSRHRAGQEIVVTDSNKSYYNVCHKDYNKK